MVLDESDSAIEDDAHTNGDNHLEAEVHCGSSFGVDEVAGVTIGPQPGPS